MPKSPKTHTYDGLANDYLKKVFPRHWHFKQSREMDSGREYGIDLTIEVVDSEDDEVTGYEFIVQNKKATVRNKHISVSIETDSIKYLCTRRGEAVLLHGYDVDKKIGYWIWLKDWFATANKSKINKQEKINVQIPKSNLLTSDTVPELLRYVQSKHRKTMLRDMADYHSDADPNFRYVYTSTEHGESMSVSLKTAQLPPEELIHMNFSVDEEQDRILREAREHGLLTEITPTHVEFHDNLDWYRDTFEIIGDWKITFIPLVPDIRVPLNISLADKQGNTIYDVGYFKSKPVQLGTKYQKWEMTSTRNLITAYLSYELDSKKPELKFNFDWKDRSNVEVLKCLKAIHHFNESSRLQIKNLETEEIGVIDIENSQFTNIPEYMFRLVTSVVEIEKTLDIVINIPPQVDFKEILVAEEIVKILKTGKSENYSLLPKDVPDGLFLGCRGSQSVDVARQMVEEFDTEGFLVIPSSEIQDNIQIRLFGTTISLGSGCQMMYMPRIFGKQYLEEFLSSEYVTDDMGAYLHFEIDPQKSFTIFENWLPEEDD